MQAVWLFELCFIHHQPLLCHGERDISLCLCGGLIGENDHSTVVNSYARGSAATLECAGGVAGNNYYGTITNCYGTEQQRGIPVLAE